LTDRGGDRRPLSLRLYAQAARHIAPRVLTRRASQGKEDAARLGERLGRASRPRPGGPLIWLHGASVGEGLSLAPLAQRLVAERPDATVLVTTTTRASAALLASRLPDGAIHQYAPLDSPRAVAAFLDHWRPSVGVFVESELWPNLILAAGARGVRLALVSARMSPGSLRGWRRFPGAARAVLGAFELILARDEAAAEGLRSLGVTVAGLADMKIGAPAPEVDEDELATLRAALAERTVLLAASTHPGEESLVLEAFSRAADGTALLILTPRHPERGAAVEALALSAGFSAARRSEGFGPEGVDVYVADTLGELGLWYSLAALAVVGGSLIPGAGGHNPLEPARLGCPFVSGPHVENWPVYGELAAHGATRLVDDAAELAPFFRQAIEDPSSLTAMAQTARAVVGALDAGSGTIGDRVLGLLGT